MVKALKFIVKTNIFEGLEGCARERYPQNIKNETNIHPKIDEQSIQIHARKRDTQNMEIHQNNNPRIMYENKSIEKYAKIY